MLAIDEAVTTGSLAAASLTRAVHAGFAFRRVAFRCLLAPARIILVYLAILAAVAYRCAILPRAVLTRFAFIFTRTVGTIVARRAAAPAVPVLNACLTAGVPILTLRTARPAAANLAPVGTFLPLSTIAIPRAPFATLSADLICFIRFQC